MQHDRVRNANNLCGVIARSHNSHKHLKKHQHVFFVRIVLTTSALSNLYCKTYESARTEQFFSFFIMIPLQRSFVSEAIVTLVTTLSYERRPRDKYSDVT